MANVKIIASTAVPATNLNAMETRMLNQLRMLDDETQVYFTRVFDAAVADEDCLRKQPVLLRLVGGAS
ncbi:MAG: hypothetical protein ACRYGK_00180 [Janthinobacterium lividum]